MAIQLFVPEFRVDEVLSEIKECLERGWTGMGYKTVEIEQKWTDYTGLPHAHFLNSATGGLHLALEVFKNAGKWMVDDEVISTGLTFISTNHAILHAGLKPVFADTDDFLCMDPDSIKSKVGPKTKAVIFVALGGNIGQLPKVAELCRQLGLKLILDAAHMAGAKYLDKDPGYFSDCTVYSFQAVKNMPTADSGMICFANSEDDQVARKMSWLGINADTYARSISTNTSGKAAPYKWYYDVEYPGWKYNGNSIMAGMALVALKYLDADNNRRREISDIYEQGLSAINGIKVVPMPEGHVSSRHLYQVLVENRDEIVGKLNSVQVNPGVHYRDNILYRMYSYAEGTCPNTRYASDRILSLPLHVQMTDADAKFVVEKLIDAVS